ncbi:hypothetical protein [Nannocystis sp. SCPEA4]|uniref:hypothetical protein n=1 Tax=Nannocystis sp. SCPEA4 TaxID=2996787 RepID=UPI0022703490|nr:hypothetical protein [Nannocystis sp. SCPEA4]MCY1061479.1 hypothetical protein [Nannocystis sp. SCPEA4]
MLKITREQMDGFRQQSAHAFQERMAAHIGEQFPLLSTVLGPDTLTRVIEKGIASAALHGIVKEKDVCRLIELMCVVGEGRDAAPDDGWMTAILDHATPANFSARLEQLGALASQRLTKGETTAGDPALQKEAAAALSGADARPFDERAGIEDPVTPCPAGPAKKRLCSFSS